MIFNHPDTLQLWINVFFTVAAVSVAFALATLVSAVRDLQAGVSTLTDPVTQQQLDEVHALTRHAA